jgi:hypothetical protein
MHILSLAGDARKRDMAMNTTMGVIMGETFHKELAMQKQAKIELLERHKDQLEAMGKV